MTDSTTPPLHPDLAPLGDLVGAWSGAGTGSYPTIESFGYLEQISFTATPKPFLAYRQQTWATDDGRPLHVEVGYLRIAAPGRVEWMISHPIGITELSEGTLMPTGTGFVLALESTTIALSSTAESVTAVNRILRLAGDQLSYELEMAAVGHSMTHHLAASLQKVPAA